MMEIKNFKAIHDREYIFELIEQGEHENQDFKFSISDSRKIARSISAFANNSGGRLLVGVKDNGKIAGLRNEEEFYMIEQAAEMYCKPAYKVEQTLYCVEGKFVLLVDVPATDKRPVMAQDDNRKWRTYYRVEDENIVAPSLLVKIWTSKKAKGVLFEYSPREAAVLRLISQKEMATLQEIEVFCHLSNTSATDIAVFLCSMDVIECKYIRGEWRFVVPQQTD